MTNYKRWLTMEKNDKVDINLYKKINDCFSESKFSKIKMLKIIIGSLVNTQCDINQIFTMIPEDIRMEIVNSLVMAYIELWLENDESNKKTIYSYVEDISQMQSQLSAGRLYVPATIRTEMNKGEKLMRKNVLLQNKYSEENNFKYKKLSPKLDYGNKYTLLELESFYRTGVEPLGIYRDIFKNDEPYHTKHRSKDFSEHKRNHAKTDYDEYREYLKQVNNLINDNDSTNEKPTKNDKEFVVKCLYIWKIERTYRYRFTALLSKYLRDNRSVIKKIPVSDTTKKIPIPDTIKNYIRNIPVELEKGEIRCCYSYFIKSYEKIINSGYSDLDNAHCEVVGIARACFEECFSILRKNFRSETLLGSWTDDDFGDVARYMIHEYGIRECLEIPDMGEVLKGRKSSYLYVRKLFENPDYMDADQITYYKAEIDKM